MMKILIPVEEEKFADLQIDFLLHHDWVEPVSICLLYVMHDMHPVEAESLVVARRYGEDLLKKVVHKIEKLRPQIGIQMIIVEGHSSEAILRTAAEWDAELIILGSHGRTGLPHAVLGSVAYDVLAASPCATLIVGMPRNQHIEDEETPKVSFTHTRT
jgi:nucleotide-binding universal stress UspA family protein